MAKPTYLGVARHSGLYEFHNYDLCHEALRREPFQILLRLWQRLKFCPIKNFGQSRETRFGQFVALLSNFFLCTFLPFSTHLHKD